MLVLSRKKHESVRTDGPCLITVVEIRGDKVRLGFTAPDSVGIWRTEIIDAELIKDIEAQQDCVTH